MDSYDPNHQFICPKCKSKDINEEWQENDEKSWMVEYFCNDCRNYFTRYYKKDEVK